MSPPAAARLLRAEEPVQPGVVTTAVVIIVIATVPAVPATPLTNVADAWGVGQPRRVLVVALEDDDTDGNMPYRQ